MKSKFKVFSKFICFALAAALVFSLTACSKELVWGNVPAVSEVTLTAAEGEPSGKVGSRHLLSYTAPEGCKISISVDKDAEPATADDFAYNDADKSIVFYAAGKYTVTVMAAAGGYLGSASTEIDITQKSVEDVSIKNVKIYAAAGSEAGVVGAAHVLSYIATGGSIISVSVRKGDKVVPAEEYSYNPVNNKITFSRTGEYTVTVKATLGLKSAEASAKIVISSHAAPTVSLTADKEAVDEDEVVTLTHNVTYVTGDYMKEESLTVEYRADPSADFAPAHEDSYLENAGTFTPGVAGEYRLTYVAVSACGAEGSDSVEITVAATPFSITPGPDLTDIVKIKKGVESEFRYIPSSSPLQYDVSFDTHGSSDITAKTSSKTGFSLLSDVMGVYDVTVNFTHKIDSTKTCKLDVTVCVVDDVANSPSIDGDPFAQMSASVLNGIGHMLYFDATTASGAKLPAENVSYEITSSDLTAAQGTASVEVQSVLGGKYSYVFVSNLAYVEGAYKDVNGATGTFTVKATATDPELGGKLVVYKTFTVSASGTGSALQTAVNKYYTENKALYSLGMMSVSPKGNDLQKTKILRECVITKSGLWVRRSNNPWYEAEDSNNDFGFITMSSAAKNCSLSFKLTLIDIGTLSNNFCLGIALRPIDTNGWAGFLNLCDSDGKIVIDNVLDHKGNIVDETGPASVSELPDATPGTVVYFRIVRQQVDDIVMYKFFYKLEGGEGYKLMYSFISNKTTANNEAGSPIYQFQFTDRYGGGSYIIEDVKTSQTN